MASMDDVFQAAPDDSEAMLAKGRAAYERSKRRRARPLPNCFRFGLPVAICIAIGVTLLLVGFAPAQPTETAPVTVPIVQPYIENVPYFDTTEATPIDA